jgi:hypothetical protein
MAEDPALLVRHFDFAPYFALNRRASQGKLTTGLLTTGLLFSILDFRGFGTPENGKFLEVRRKKRTSRGQPAVKRRAKYAAGKAGGMGLK